MTTNSPSSKVLHDWSYAIVLVDAISGEPDPAEEHAPPGAITFRLRLDKPGLPELLLLTERHRPTRELHILCPGRIDRIALGTTVVTLRSLREDREMRAAFITLGQLLADATLVLGGANVGQGHDGQAFLQTLADLVQTEVSALVRVPPRPKAISPGAQSLFSSADHASSGGTSIQRRSCQLR